MASIPVEVSDEQLQRLRKRAEREGMSPEEYLRRLVERELAPRAERVSQATERVLERNHELYDRLS